MTRKNISLEQLQSITDLDKTTSRISLGEVFADKPISSINEYALFIAHFNLIPNCITEIKIDCKKAALWFLETHLADIKDLYYNRKYFKKSRIAEYDDIFCFLFEDLIVDFDTNQSEARFLFRNTSISKVEAIIAGIKKFRQRKTRRKPEISLLMNTIHGIDTKSLPVLKPRLNIEDNYNDDFKEIHQTILKRLSRRNDKGLVLLHGRPGTGKTSYIRYLVSVLKKNVIFLPPNMAAAITNPNLISILIDNPNSIFVIEDAENIVVDREKDGYSPVSALLNISDGLLSDCLNIQVICSFNTDISKVDSALMRKGRLIAKYEFKELEVYKANALSKKLGFDKTFNLPVTLTGIYNQEEREFIEVGRSVIGFRINNDI